MARRSSTSSSHARRTSSVSAAVPVPSLTHVMESENERDDIATITANATQELEETQRLEAERDARFQEADKELMSVLETDGVSDHVRKRQLTRLFDRFRYEYTQLSTRFRDNLRMQRKIMDKCQEMKNELVMSAIKIKTAKQLQDEEMKNLLFYREECEHAWKSMSVCEERERDAVRIIDELKSEIEELQCQVKVLLGMDTSGGQRNASKSKTSISSSSQQSPSEMGSLSPVRSPTKRLVPVASQSVSSPSKTTRSNALNPSQDNQPRLLSFDEWKLSTRVWSPPSSSGSVPKAATPFQSDLFLLERKQEIARCVSVPSLQPTAMERAATAIDGASGRITLLSPSRRATTSVSGKRIPSASQPLPSVSLPTRKLP